MTDFSSPRHMPYGGMHKPFAIGLSQLPLSQWLEPDDELGRYLDEKAALLKKDAENVFRADEDTLPAQREALSLISDHLAKYHADRFQRTGDRITAGSGHSVSLSDETIPPLMRAGLMIQDDLAILCKRGNEWHLAAGFIAFPSSWLLAEKAGRPMSGVHETVPGFQAGTRNAKLVERIFDNLKPDLPAERFNWSFKGSPSLAMPPLKEVDGDPFRPVRPIAANFIRVERQTLRRLPQTGAVLFTIRIYSDPLAVIARHKEAERIARAMMAQLQALTREERAYKGMTDSDVAALTAYLAKVSTSTVEPSR